MKVTRKYSFLLCGLISIIMLLSFIMLMSTPTVAKAGDESIYQFSQISDTECSVSINDKTITTAIIPSHYNGLLVTEIATNGFMSCPNLETVLIPRAVTKISVGAFMNCGKLKTLSMAGVKEIGQNAFAMCTKLDNLVLPQTLKTVGSSFLRANKNTVFVRLPESSTTTWGNWLASFSGNVVYEYYDILYEDIFENDEIVGYSIKPSQSITDNTLDLRLDYHNNLPIMNIQWGAFWGCTLNSITIGSSSYHEINIEGCAFAESNIKGIAMGNKVTFKDPTSDTFRSESLFVGSAVEQVVLPNTMEAIPNTTFQNCKELVSINFVDSSTKNQLPSSVIDIGIRAFEGCTKLNSLYIPETVVTTGDNIFVGWTADDTIEINLYELPSGWHEYWNGSGVEPTLLKYNVNFYANRSDANYFVDQIFIKHNTMLSSVSNISKPYCERYLFNEKWYKDPTCQNEFFPTDKFVGDMSLYAGWNVKEYSIIYELNGGVNSTSNPDSFSAEETIYLHSPTREEYYFGGWYKDSNFNNKIEYIYPGDTNSDITIYAKWHEPLKMKMDTGLSFTEDFGFFSGIAFDLPTPSKPGYQGYWKIYGQKYEFGSQYLSTVNFTAIAQWTPLSFTQTYNQIYCYEQLLEFAQGTRNNLYRNTNIDLRANINLAGKYWVPIKEFNATFNGNNFTISNFSSTTNIQNTAINYGFFDKLDTNSTVQYLNFDNTYMYISGEAPSTRSSLILFGTIAGVTYGKIKYCNVTNFTCFNNSTRATVGGIVGNVVNNASVSNCSVSGKAQNWGSFGGICGVVNEYGESGASVMMNGTIDTCTFNGNIETDQRGDTSTMPYSGGIVASNFGYANNCTVSGSITYTTARREKDTTVYPKMGKVVASNYGRYSVVTSAGMKIFQGSLYSFKYGAFWLSSHNQAEHAQGGDVGLDYPLPV